MSTTTDLSKFGNRELGEASALLRAASAGGLPKEFSDEGMTLMFNDSSGNVFLTNKEFQVAMFNGDKLEMFYTCPECGNEGFVDDMLMDFINHDKELDPDNMNCCTEYLQGMGLICWGKNKHQGFWVEV